MESRPRLVWGLVLALTVLGAILRLHDLGAASLWKDEIHQASAVRAPIGVFMDQLDEVENDMPLDYIAQHLVLCVAPETDFWVRFHAALFGILTIPAAFLLLRALVGPTVGLVATTLLAVSPFHLHYSQEGRPYALLLLLTVVSTWALWRLMRTERRLWLWGILYFITAIASVWAHLAATLVIASQQLWVVTSAAVTLQREEVTKRSTLTRAGLSLGVAAVAALSIVPVMRRVTGGSIGDAGIPFTPIDGDLFLTYLNGFSFARDEYIQWFPAWLIAAPLIVLGLGWGFRRRAAATWLLVCVGIGLPVLMVGLCWRREHWFSLRYVFPALVPVLGLAALGAVAAVEGLTRLAAPEPRMRLGVVAGTLGTLCLALALAAGAFLWNHPAVKRDWRGAADWVATHIGLEETLLISDSDWRRITFYMDRHAWLGNLEVMDRDELLEIDPAEHVGKHVFLRSGSTYNQLRGALEDHPVVVEPHRISIIRVEPESR
jgi:hypothetical protein